MEDKILKFYLNNFTYLTDENDIDVSFIPSIARRRMSLLDRVAVHLLNKTFLDNTEHITYSSQYGEVERLLKLIDQYSELKEVSPNLFSGSVHNYPVGFFFYNIKKPIPYSALSAVNNTITSSILSAVVSSCDNTLFCYCDVNNNKITSMAFNISKKPLEKSAEYQITLKNSDKKEDFEEYVKLFKGKIKNIHAPLFILERV